MKTVGSVLELAYGRALRSEDRSGGDVPVVGSGGIVGTHSAGITDGRTIVVGRKGSIGSVTWIDGPAWPIDTAYYVKSKDPDLDLRWAYWMLRSMPLASMNKSAAIPGLNRDDVYRLLVSVPPSHEQKRIAALLDQVDAVRTKRRQMLEHFDSLSEAVFHEMFAGVNASTTVAAQASLIRTGPFGSQLRHGEFVDEGIAVLGLDNVVGNQFRWGERRYISAAKYEQLKRYTVAPDDVLISIMGTVGRCVVVPEHIPTAINTKHICAITPDRAKLDSQFLRAAFLWHSESRAHLRRQTKGSIMHGLNMGIIKAMPIPLPPLERQQEFAVRVAAIGKRRATAMQALAVEDELFASLQARAFRGEL